MAKRDPILFDEKLPIVWTVSTDTIHVVVYKLWIRPPGSKKWVELQQGSTGDDNPRDWGDFKVPRLTGFSYWLGIGSTQPQSQFTTSITLTQKGVVIQDGLLLEMGRVNKKGVSNRQERVTLR